jgi:hypothetical protein
MENYVLNMEAEISTEILYLSIGDISEESNLHSRRPPWGRETSHNDPPVYCTYHPQIRNPHPSVLKLEATGPSET